MKGFAAAVALLVMGSMFEYGQPENVLPDAFCSYLSYMFRKEGCLEDATFFCKLLAFKFNANFGGRAICPQFTCQGYTSSGHQCRGFFSCPFGRIRTKGMCQLGKICCADPA